MKKFILILCLILMPLSSFAKENIYIIERENPGDMRYEYSNLLLKTAFEKTAEFGEVKFVATPHPMTRNRQLEELQVGKYLDVVAQAPKPEWEEKLIPIYIPLKKGIKSYRLFLINGDRQKDFSNITSLDEIKKLQAGAGSQWSNTAVMKATGFNLVTSPEYARLFPMLKAGRFDFFPRGIDEIWREYEFNKKGNIKLVIEKDLALYFPITSYFFVNPRKEYLAKRIRLGLDRMIDDGSFDKIFNKYYGEYLTQADLKNRRLFKVTDSTVSEKTPYHIEKYWYKIN